MTLCRALTETVRRHGAAVDSQIALAFLRKYPTALGLGEQRLAAFWPDGGGELEHAPNQLTVS